MNEMNRVESVASEAAVLVGVLLAQRREHHGDPLDELGGPGHDGRRRVVGR